MNRLDFCPCCGGMLDGENWGEVVQWMNLIGIDVAVDGSMTTKAAARYLGRSPQTLKNWRVFGDGPVYRKDAKGRVFYYIEDLESFRQGRCPDYLGVEYSITPSNAKYIAPKG